jgi:hypothetical protein
MNTALRRVVRSGVVMLMAATAMPACTTSMHNDASSSYLIIDALEASAGAKPDEFGGTLASDVLTLVKKDVGGTQVLVPTVFEDALKVTLSLGMKDPGTSASATAPSTVNSITVTRYHVKFIRSDGRNLEGVDVPYAFDGAATVTVGSGTSVMGMTLVRIQAKNEAPLKALINGGGAYAISTIAEVTLYGTDQAGHDVSVTGKISVNFADWGDPT